MNKKLLRKLVKNALEDLDDYYADQSCNDLTPGHPLLKGVTKEEFAQIVRRWKKLCPRQAKEFDGVMSFDSMLLETITKSI